MATSDLKEVSEEEALRRNMDFQREEIVDLYLLGTWLGN